ENGYTPDEPITITLEEGPYMIKGSNGTPDRYMSFIYFDGADTERYMDVFKSSGGTWYGYESQYKHLLASVKEPIVELPDLPVEDVPESERYYTEKHDTVDKHVEFEINTESISADELEAMGYTISEDRKTASRDTTLAKITYTFDKIPATLDELKKFSLKSNVEGDFDYGMFAPMAATILAIHTYGTDKEEAFKMLEYIYGPNQTFSNFDKQFVQTQFMTKENEVLQNCYFGGASPENGYTPDEPITITLEEGPYMIKGSNGTPDRYMSFIYFDGADTERYMDVFKSSGGTWYGYESQYKHLLAGVKEPTGTAPETTTTTTTTETTTTTTTTVTTTETSETGTTTTTKVTTTTPTTAEDSLGDIDGNGDISADDAQMVLQEYVNILANKPRMFTTEQFAAADINGDGVIGSDDAQYILQYYVLKLANIKVTWRDLVK
ncbi:MAG: dockerin type I repeat-containing protein, partial [Oscillospiraceae bacterium]|nr:dockerin type I repeat-containing protein [Oscillospiraceae bacterium]